MTNELEENWLCDPNKLEFKKNSTQQQHRTTKKKLLEDLTNSTNSTNNANGGGGNGFTRENDALDKAKTPYNWMMEDFEDKNLDKMKRTLLVALDDISKGLSKL